MAPGAAIDAYAEAQLLSGQAASPSVEELTRRALKIKQERSRLFVFWECGEAECHAVGPHASCTAEPAKFVLPPSAWHLSSCMSSAAAVHKLHTFSDPMHTRWSEAAALALGATTRAATNGTLQARIAEVDRLRAGCLDPKGYSRLARMPQPLREYPDVPRALASNAERFADMML